MRRKQPQKLNPLKQALKRLHKLSKDHFIPHPGNNHIPHVLHHRALFGYSVLLISLKVMVVGVGVIFPSISLLSSAITPANIVSLTNETRRSLELPELTVDPKLAKAAQAKAEDMFLNSYFAHTSPEGVTPWHWFKTYGYNYRSAGENLAAHFVQAEDVEAGWMASPTHRENIVSDRYNEIGVGVAQGTFEGYQTTFVVQMFGYELNQPPAAHEIVNGSNSEIEEIIPEVAETPEIEEPKTSVLADTIVDDEAIQVDTSSLLLTPIDSGYKVEIYMKNVNEAVLYMGNVRVPLVAVAEMPDMWTSVLFYNQATISSDGERIYLVAGSVKGEQQIVDLAWIMPGNTAPEVYAFKGTDAPKLLGVMDIADLDDNVRKFYIFTLIFLGGALLIAVFVKIEVQRPTMIAHGLAVLTLALLLTFL